METPLHYESGGAGLINCTLDYAVLVDTIACGGIFGWNGAAESCTIMDKERRLSLVYMQHVRNCGYAYGTIHPTLRELMYEN